MSVNMKKVYVITSMEYMKIQDLNAVCGGFISFIHLLLSFVSSFSNRVEMN